MQNFERPLLVPRALVYFKVVEGRLEYVCPGYEIEPVVITSQRRVDFEGFASGTRSGVMHIMAPG